MKKFEINGKKYGSRPFDFNMVCDFEDAGIEVDKMRTKQTAAIRAYFAKCSGLELEDAGKEIEQHLISGGKLDGIANAMAEEMENSDFFRSLQKTETEEATEDAEKESKKE